MIALVWGAQRAKAAAIMDYWRAIAFLASLGSEGSGLGLGLHGSTSTVVWRDWGG